MILNIQVEEELKDELGSSGKIYMTLYKKFPQAVWEKSNDGYIVHV